jgi:Chromo (CHRromatin Organisation MOdifier) domain
MNQWIANYVKGCAICQQNKILTHQKKTPLYQITTQPDTCPFQQIAMDLITSLPRYQGKDAILTIVDHRYSRAAVFIPCSTTITGVGIAQLYLKHVYKCLGLPTKIISDQDLWFTSHFGKALSQKLGIKQNLSSIFHPQTDRISERKNQWVEQYLHLVTSMAPEDWTQWLDLASLVYNNQKNETTRLSLNVILFGYGSEAAPLETTHINNEDAERCISIMMERWQQAIWAINQAAKGGQNIALQYQVGDQVWLKASHIKTHHQKMKLALKHYGPFQIKREISPVAYQLTLPISWGIHNVFHALLLHPYHETREKEPNFTWPPPKLIGGEEEYEVETIRNHQCQGQSKQLQYLIKWKGYPESDNTWEPADQVHMLHADFAYCCEQLSLKYATHRLSFLGVYSE